MKLKLVFLTCIVSTIFLAFYFMPRNQLVPQAHTAIFSEPKLDSKPEPKKQAVAPIKHKAIPLTAKAKRAIILASQADNLDPKILELALTAHQEAKSRGLVRKPLITVIDYSKPSIVKRLWIFDLAKNKLIYETYVSHGEGSGSNFATHFSNQQDSHQTSIGVFTTGETYEGMYGLSLKLDGRDKGFNDNARRRRIVMHGADFAREEYIHEHGVLGTSWACPSISDEIADQVINLIKGGSLIFSYYPDQRWLGTSPFLNVD